MRMIQHSRGFMEAETGTCEGFSVKNKVRLRRTLASIIYIRRNFVPRAKHSVAAHPPGGFYRIGNEEFPIRQKKEAFPKTWSEMKVRQMKNV